MADADADADVAVWAVLADRQVIGYSCPVPPKTVGHR
jgi:hypothetical protein